MYDINLTHEVFKGKSLKQIEDAFIKYAGEYCCENSFDVYLKVYSDGSHGVYFNPPSDTWSKEAMLPYKIVDKVIFGLLEEMK